MLQPCGYAINSSLNSIDSMPHESPNHQSMVQITGPHRQKAASPSKENTISIWFSRLFKVPVALRHFLAIGPASCTPHAPRPHPQRLHTQLVLKSSKWGCCVVGPISPRTSSKTILLKSWQCSKAMIQKNKMISLSLPSQAMNVKLDALLPRNNQFV